jgi:YesN/AraC family two-component response regulator
MCKGYLKQGITINDVAAQIGTNRTYLSNLINAKKLKHFNSWVNELRVEEAKRIMAEHPELNIGDVSEMVGYSEQSNFTHHFTETTGVPPHKWRKNSVI